MKKHFALVVLSLVSAVLSAGTERIFRPARYTRGNTNVVKIQPIDDAAWIWHRDDLAMSVGAGEISHSARSGGAVCPVMVFEKDFEVREGEKPFEIDVSADERFCLTLDGEFVARGPNRADVSNWQYNTYRVTLAPGRHVFRAVVTRLGEHAPQAQLSYRGGFIFKASGEYDERLTTGKAKWRVAWWKGMTPAGADNGVWGTGSQFAIRGTYPTFLGGEEDSRPLQNKDVANSADSRGRDSSAPIDWQDPVVVRAPAGRGVYPIWGARTPGWMLFPSQLPDQLETPVRPGEFRAATTNAVWRQDHVYTASETDDPLVGAFNRLLRGESAAVTVPAKTKVQLAWNLGDYLCAYPVVRTANGGGARLSLSFSESAYDAETNRKGNRGEIVGKYLRGYGDTFFCDGTDCAFSTPWFRCGLWVRLDVETQEDPLEIRELSLIESRYPLEMASGFSSPDDPSLADVRRICARAMQMCCHETLFDCPYYEQQMYPGDTRVQLLVLSAMSRDDRIVKRAIEIYDLATRDDGQCPFNFPTRGTQEGFTYTQCFLLMFGDYAMNHADREWLRARLPGFRKSMAGCELYENAEGLLEDTPGWNFMDWVVGWPGDGTMVDTENGRKLNSFVNLMWLLDVQSAAKVERAFGNDRLAAHWEAKAERLKAAIVAKFWDEKRSLVANTVEKNAFCEHCQAMAIIGGLLPKDKEEELFRHLVEDLDLARTTVYFNYYLFEAYFKMGRSDLFQKRLDLWRDFVGKGLTTLSEQPDTPVAEGRSDCHAWGAHPIWFMQSGIAGIRSDAPWFEKVVIEPQPGALKSLKAKHPHPKGWIEVDLEFDGDKVHGTVVTPVPGTFRYGKTTMKIGPDGENTL